MKTNLNLSFTDTLGDLSKLSCNLVVNLNLGGMLTSWVIGEDINHVTSFTANQSGH